MLANSAEVSTIGRIRDDRGKWRVLVEAWPEQSGYAGRLVFAPDGADAAPGMREGPSSLRGSTREDVVSQVHEMPETRLRAMLHSLG
jgi:hypothetical protein